MNGQTLTSLLPAPPLPWTRQEPARTYERESLYNYIDGGAELFISYDFITAVSQKYTADNQPDLVVDIFDMGTSANAYGVFCHVRETEDTRFGQGAQVYDDAIVFWKGRYYVSIMAYDITPEVKTALPQLAGTIDQSLKDTGPLPRVVGFLPAQGLKKNSILYFHHYIWQNNLGYLADTNFLNIGPGTDAVLARYDNGATLLIVEYHDKTKAGKGLASFADIYEFPPDNPVTGQLEDHTWMGAKTNNTCFVLVFRTSDSSDTESLLNSIKIPRP